MFLGFETSMVSAGHRFFGLLNRPLFFFIFWGPVKSSKCFFNGENWFWCIFLDDPNILDVYKRRFQGRVSRFFG